MSISVNKKIGTIRLIVIVVLILSFLSLLYCLLEKNYALLSSGVYKNDYISEGKISEVSTSLSGTDTSWRRINTEDVFFDAFSPQGATKVTIKFVIDNIDQKVINVDFEQTNPFDGHILRETKVLEGIDGENLDTRKQEFETEFGLSEAFIRDGKYIRFHLVFPERRQTDKGISLRSIEVDYETPNLLERLF